MKRLLKTGAGWRLGWDPEAPEFKGLVGGDDWAIELTQMEFNDLRRLSEQLQHTMDQMRSQLMEEERISCELESDLLWLEAEGFAQDYSLRVIVRSGRCAEGFWSVAAVPEFLQALSSMPLTSGEIAVF
jgi:hypothetical protein